MEEKKAKLFWVEAAKDLEAVNEFIGDRKAKVEVFQQHGTKAMTYLVRIEESK